MTYIKIHEFNPGQLLVLNYKIVRTIRIMPIPSSYGDIDSKPDPEEKYRELGVIFFDTMYPDQVVKDHEWHITDPPVMYLETVHLIKFRQDIEIDKVYFTRSDPQADPTKQITDFFGGP